MMALLIKAKFLGALFLLQSKIYFRRTTYLVNIFFLKYIWYIINIIILVVRNKIWIKMEQSNMDSRLSPVYKHLTNLSLNTDQQQVLAKQFAIVCTNCRLQANHTEAIYMAHLALEHMGIDWSQFIQGKIKIKEGYVLDLSLVSQLLYDLSIAVYYVELPTHGDSLYLGRWICDLLMLSPAINKDFLHSTSNNARFYYKPLSYTQKHKFDVKLPAVYEGSEEYYNAMNPSLVPANQGYIANVRAVNYSQEFAVHFTSHDIDGKIRTKNFLLGLDENFKTMWQAEIVDNSGLSRVQGAPIEGLEDIRLFWLTSPCGNIIFPPDYITSEIVLARDYYGIDLEQLAFTCTTANTHSSCVPQISIGRFSPYVTDQGQISICQLQPLVSWKQPGNPHRLCEKNWLSFPLQPIEGLIIYDYQPLTMVKCPLILEWQNLVQKNQNKDYDKIEEKTYAPPELALQPQIYNSRPALRLDKQRGSGGPIPFIWQDKWGYLLVTHSVITTDNKRIYSQRFIFYDQEFKLQALSYPFIFEQLGIEYCSALIPDQDGYNILLGVGIEDREAWLYKVSKEVVNDMLHSVHIANM